MWWWCERGNGGDSGGDIGGVYASESILKLQFNLEKKIFFVFHHSFLKN